MTAALAAGQESPPVRTLRGHNESVSGIDFSPDDQRLVSVANDYRLKLWDVPTGQEALSLRELIAWYSQVLFCPDGQRIVMLSYGLKVFDLASEQYPTDDARDQGVRQRAIVWHRKLAQSCEREGHWIGAAFHLGQLIDLQPDDQPLKLRRGVATANAFADRGEWSMAAAEYEKVIELGGDNQGTNHSMWGSLAVLRLAADDSDGYRAACTKLLDAYGDSDDPATLNSVAWTCALSPAASDPDLVVQLAERSLAKSPPSNSHFVLNTLGAALFRAGRYQESVERLNQSLTAHGRGGVVEDWLFLAMAHAQLDHPSEARQWLDKANQWIDQAIHQKQFGEKADPSFAWRHEIELRSLQQEAMSVQRE